MFGAVGWGGGCGDKIVSPRGLAALRFFGGISSGKEPNKEFLFVEQPQFFADQFINL